MVSILQLEQSLPELSRSQIFKDCSKHEIYEGVNAGCNISMHEYANLKSDLAKCPKSKMYFVRLKGD